MRYLTGGESHGQALVAVIEGIPANLALTAGSIDYELSRRQKGYGRGGRMDIEKDRVNILSGIRNGITLGSPITLEIKNNDGVNWEKIMSPLPGAGIEAKKITKPRPGHADLPGCIKYQQADIRNILERSSARETAARVAVGAVAKCLLRELGVFIGGHVVAIGQAVNPKTYSWTEDPEGTLAGAEVSPVRCLDEQASKEMMAAIDHARSKGDSLGGVFEIIGAGVPAGLGSHVQWDRKLDGRLAGALMSIQGIKGVEIGIGFEAARLPGSLVHDEIFYAEEKGFFRKTNRAGGLEGGMSNGEILVVRAAMKPIPTLMSPLHTVDLQNKKAALAQVERSDTCAVPAACVVGEAVFAWEIGQVVMEKFGGDNMAELKKRMAQYRKYVKQV